MSAAADQAAQTRTDAEAESLSSFVPGRVYAWAGEGPRRSMVVITMAMPHAHEWLTRPEPEFLLLLLPGRAVPLACPCKRKNWRELP